mmetsp:Transcript_34259/g.59973  ORF Transcript_34259/g.59973 Transcript_34259/m.59973 type:complete len:165 (+) Transcript_34259:17-511(+)
MGACFCEHKLEESELQSILLENATIGAEKNGRFLSTTQRLVLSPTFSSSTQGKSFDKRQTTEEDKVMTLMQSVGELGELLRESRAWQMEQFEHVMIEAKKLEQQLKTLRNKVNLRTILPDWPVGASFTQSTELDNETAEQFDLIHRELAELKEKADLLIAQLTR